MSKFINTQHMTTINSLVDGLKKRLDNPYYLYNDQKACIVDYFNLNTTRSTLDEGAKIPYAIIGKDSPLKYNFIENAYLFGIDKIQIQSTINEFGFESDAIEGEAIVLPNTFIPMEQDYFSIKYLKQTILFKVVDVTTDTLDSGANFYKIQYKLDLYDESANKIYDQIAEKFKMIVTNVGTNYNTIIRSNDYDLIDKLDSINLTLKKYFKQLFFDNKAQTFSYVLTGDKIYDPYMIEFLIRNKLMEGDDEYIYVSHQAILPATFAIDYDRSFFRTIELKDKDNMNRTLQAIGIGITDMNSLMSTCSRPYYMLEYNRINIYTFNTRIEIFSADLIDKIESGKLYNNSEVESMWNILIAYFNNMKLNDTLLSTIEKIDYNYCKDVFYAIPIIIFCIESYIKNLLR